MVVSEFKNSLKIVSVGTERGGVSGGTADVMGEQKVVFLTVGPVLGQDGKKDKQTTLNSFTAQV